MPNAYYKAGGGTHVRALSPKIWGDCDVLKYAMPAPERGSYYFNDFMRPFDTASGQNITITQVNSGTVTMEDTQHGVIKFDSNGNNAADDGVNAQFTGTDMGETFLVGDEKRLWFECCLKVSAIDEQYFVGLAETETALIASGALDTTGISLIGFFVDAGTTSGYVEFASANSGTAEEITDPFDCENEGIVLTADEWFKLGFVVEYFGDQHRVRPYCAPCASNSRDWVNGQWITDTDDIPTHADADLMVISAVAQTETAAADGEMSWDWVCVAQEA